MKSIENNFDDPKVNELLNKHFIELRSVSPEGSSHVLDIPGLKDPSIRFWSLWENDELIGCGALKTLEPDHGELIDRSQQLGFKKLSVETGSGEFFAPARKLFKSFGFEPCEPFAHYKEDPNSCYYSLKL